MRIPYILKIRSVFYQVERYNEIKMATRRNYPVKPSIFYKIANKLVLLLFLIVLVTGSWVVMTYSAKWLYELSNIAATHFLSSLTRRGLQAVSRKAVEFFSPKQTAQGVAK
ncbi:hypothetical protein CBL_12000 [Carabus blaptoides fortunei]